MWAGGPPKPMQPIRPHSRSTVARLAPSPGTASRPPGRRPGRMSASSAAWSAGMSLTNSGGASVCESAATILTSVKAMVRSTGSAASLSRTAAVARASAPGGAPAWWPITRYRSSSTSVAPTWYLCRTLAASISRRSSSSGRPAPASESAGHPTSTNARPCTEKVLIAKCWPWLVKGIAWPGRKPPIRTRSGTDLVRMSITRGRSISRRTPACASRYALTMAPVPGSRTASSAISVACTCSSE